MKRTLKKTNKKNSGGFLKTIEHDFTVHFIVENPCNNSVPVTNMLHEYLMPR